MSPKEVVAYNAGADKWTADNVEKLVFKAILERGQTQEVLFLDEIPKSCIVGAFDYQKIKQGLDKAELTAAFRPGVSKLVDRFSMRPRLAVKAAGFQGDSSARFEKLGEILANICTKHIAPNYEAMESKEMIAIFAEYAKHELVIHRHPAEHLLIWINGVPMPLTPYDPEHSGDPTQPFHVNLELPENFHNSNLEKFEIQVEAVEVKAPVVCKCKFESASHQDIHEMTFRGDTGKKLVQAQNFGGQVQLKSLDTILIDVCRQNPSYEHIFCIRFKSPFHQPRQMNAKGLVRG